MGFIVRLLVNAAALAAAAWVVPGIEIANWQSLLIAALIFGLVNAFVKPVFSLLTCPLVVLTLGLFTLVINAVMIGLTSWLAAQADVGFHVDSFGAAFLGALVVTVVSWLLSRVTP